MLGGTPAHRRENGQCRGRVPNKQNRHLPWNALEQLGPRIETPHFTSNCTRTVTTQPPSWQPGKRTCKSVPIKEINNVWNGRFGKVGEGSNPMVGGENTTMATSAVRPTLGRARWWCGGRARSMARSCQRPHGRGVRRPPSASRRDK